MADDEAAEKKQARDSIRSAEKLVRTAWRDIEKAVDHDLKGDEWMDKADALAAAAAAATPGSAAAKKLHDQASRAYDKAGVEYQTASDLRQDAATAFSNASDLYSQAKQAYLRAALKNYHATPPETDEGQKFQAKATLQKKFEDQCRGDAQDTSDGAANGQDAAASAFRKSAAEAAAK